jgi:hypothetical protein
VPAIKEFVASSLPRILTRAHCDPRNVDSMAAQLTALTPASIWRVSVGKNKDYAAKARPALRKMPADDVMYPPPPCIRCNAAYPNPKEN